MKNLIVLIAGCLVAVSAAAQNMNIEQKAQEVARDIQRYGRSLTGSERSEVAQKLESISRILRGGYGDMGGGNSNSSADYTCVSKDGDGLRPYIIAVRSGIDVQKTNLAFASLDECNQSLNLKRFVGGRTALLCTSKDGDGLRPFQMAAIGPRGVQKIDNTKTPSIDDCRNIVNSLQFDRNGTALFCTSKDGDGLRPIVAAEFTLDTVSVRFSTQKFDSIQECNGFIRR